MANISINGSHNAAIAIEKYNKIIAIIEIERLLGYKNSGIINYKPAHTQKYLIPFVLNFIRQEYGIREFRNCYYLETEKFGSQSKNNCHNEIPASNYIRCSHHLSHAAGTFYQSPYDTSLVFSFDGGGNDGLFNVYHADKKTDIKLIGRHEINLGLPYMVFGSFLKDIKYESSLLNGNLVYPGKLMGLCAFGKVNEEMVSLFKEYYQSGPVIAGKDYFKKLYKIENALGIRFDETNRLDGKMAYDIAATSQKAFEECFLDIIQPYIEQYPDLPICMTGGCALNIMLNTRVKVEFNKDVFIPPNPNDCGLAMGMLAYHIKPASAIDITYCGIPVLDKYSLFGYIEKYRARRLNMELLVKDLFNGAIVGVVRNNAEHGPRALGNRSIFCNPSIPDMKEVLNAKVKNREWYRPFAPVCRLEDVNKYFDFTGESRFMAFSPRVREEWLCKLRSVTHADRTARIQTVTREQNSWLYELLTAFEEIAGIGVLLNTSFNVDGRPMVSTYAEALEVYTKTQMDRLVLDDYYFDSK